jgi:predicted Zn-ribbon and HTH transcriptional regulator
MITREDIAELAHFESPEGCAVSFYFQPGRPQDMSHREEIIRVKDLVRTALHAAEKNGNGRGAREDLERILTLTESRLSGRASLRYAKAVFACSSRDFWREYDLPPRLAGQSLTVEHQFHLRPLTAIAATLTRVCIALAGRTTARFFELWGGEIRGTEKFVSELPRRGRSDGFAGYDAGHADRHVDHEALHHFKKFADRVQKILTRGIAETKLGELEGGSFRVSEFPGPRAAGAGRAAESPRSAALLVIGCRDETWPEIEPRLHPYAKQRLIGRFAFDAATGTVEQVREQADRILEDYRSRRYHELFRRVTDEAKANGLGALGIKRVLRSLESGEVQILLLGKSFAAPAAECRKCGHVEPFKSGIPCPVCSSETRFLEDVSDLLLSAAVRSGLEIIHVPPDPEFEKVGNVAALLRFRADQNRNTSQLPVASSQ